MQQGFYCAGSGFALNTASFYGGFLSNNIVSYDWYNKENFKKCTAIEIVLQENKLIKLEVGFYRTNINTKVTFEFAIQFTTTEGQKYFERCDYGFDQKLSIWPPQKIN